MSSVPSAFDPARPPGAELKRLAMALADEALRHVQAAEHGPREEPVHEARKRFKELRALLRLAAGTSVSRRARNERRLIRDAGRALSAARDADILTETFEKLRNRFGSALEPSRELQRRMSSTAASHALDTTAAVQLIGRARNDIALWIVDISADEISAAVRRSYRAARAAMRQAIETRSASDFHEWRKREKDHWYHARFLQSAFPALSAREPLLHRLSRILGDHHDLVIVREAALEAATASDAAGIVNLMLMTAQRLRELERDAAAAGGEAFALSASKFSDELRETSLAAPRGASDMPESASDAPRAERTAV